MSGLEVVAAVAAVISAFHGGSELFKIVREKRRTRKARDQSQVEWEEKQLQDSLITGEQQISLRWARDTRELGECMCIGDAIAKDRLNHIVIRFQAELIKNLESAAMHGTAPLNLRMLYQASIASKNETFATFDELKTRLYFGGQVPNSLAPKAQSMKPRDSVVTVQSSHTGGYDMDSSKTHGQPRLSTSVDPRLKYAGPQRNLVEHMRERNGIVGATSPTRAAKSSDSEFSTTLAEYMRQKGFEDPASAMQHIQDMIQFMNINKSQDVASPTHPDERQLKRHDTLTMLNGENYYQSTMTRSDRNGIPQYDPNSPRREQYGTASASTGHSWDSSRYVVQQEQLQSNAPSHDSYPFQSMSIPRWSDTTNASSPYSDAVSINRNNSSSSQGSRPHATHSVDYPSFYDNARSHAASTHPHPAYFSHRDQMLSPSSSQANSYQVGNATLNSQNYIRLPHASSPISPIQYQDPTSPISPRHVDAARQPVPWADGQQASHVHPYAASSQQPVYLQDHHGYNQSSSYPKPTFAPAPSSNANAHAPAPTGFAAVAAAARTLTSTSNTKVSRHASLTPSFTSTDSNVSGTTGILPGSRMRSLSSAPSNAPSNGSASQPKMMNGRPDKHNNYWGFCKGAWAVREKMEKGLTTRTIPTGMYNSRQVWECRECTFRGDMFTKPHPTKKHKTVEAIDTRIHESNSGHIRYRWIFLVKCHVKKKTEPAHNNEENNFGCLFCSVEENVTGIFGGVEMLMDHIASVHVAGMSERTRKMTNCVLGRMAGADEDFDINVPIFKQFEELEG